MSITFGEHEWLPCNSTNDDWPQGEAKCLPLGLCSRWGVGDDGMLFFDVEGGGDPAWMQHVFETLNALGVPFLAGIYRCQDAFAPQAGQVLQFAVIMSDANRDEFMPRVRQAYDIAERVTQGGE